ncbi:MAG: hypothetical protein JWR37_5081 [Mycobacterium sp.]|nr:hypothetical protein [Mycobacterium sp.]
MIADLLVVMAQVTRARDTGRDHRGRAGADTPGVVVERVQWGRLIGEHEAVAGPWCEESLICGRRKRVFSPPARSAAVGRAAVAGRLPRPLP